MHHLPAQTEGTMKRPQYLNSGPPKHKELPDVEMFVVYLGATSVLRATVKAVTAFWGKIPCSLVVLLTLHTMQLGSVTNTSYRAAW
jgi:hypothetical protein